jgi:hypothetical protein
VPHLQAAASHRPDTSGDLLAIGSRHGLVDDAQGLVVAITPTVLGGGEGEEVEGRRLVGLTDIALELVEAGLEGFLENGEVPRVAGETEDDGGECLELMGLVAVDELDFAHLIAAGIVEALADRDVGDGL